MKEKKNTLGIFTLVEHKEMSGQFYGYAPYIREMNMWCSHFDKVIVAGPFSKSKQLESIDLNYAHPNLSLVKIPGFNIKSIFSILRNIYDLEYLRGIFFNSCFYSIFQCHLIYRATVTGTY